ncbi:F-box/kelch-repeat protein [Trifolium repens]|nr:F-box/kelch-repeat protein [Trifolium repens]
MASNYIHDDVAFSILSKLPIKSLKRFQCVHKSWSLLFEDSCFMTKYRNNFLSNAPYDGNTSLLIDLGNELYSLSGDRFENKFKLNWPNPFLEENTNFSIRYFGSANGILCLSYIGLYNYRDRRIVLWNPTIKKFKVVPPGHEVEFGASATLYGFGYDRIADDYKMIRHVKRQPLFQHLHNYVLSNKNSWALPFWEIYNLRSNSWRTLDVNIPNSNIGIESPLNCNLQVYTNGMCHWVFDYFEGSLVSFDLNKEMVSITSVPSCITLYWPKLTLLNGSVALVSSPKKATTFHISILGEIGVKESWIKLFIVEQSCVGFSIGVGMKGKIFINKIDNEIVWFDLSTKMIKELGLKRKRTESQRVPIANIAIIIKNLTCTF